jgi:hypothetical protein
VLLALLPCCSYLLVLCQLASLASLASLATRSMIHDTMRCHSGLINHAHTHICNLRHLPPLLHLAASVCLVACWSSLLCRLFSLPFFVPSMLFLILFNQLPTSNCPFTFLLSLLLLVLVGIPPLALVRFLPEFTSAASCCLFSNPSWLRHRSITPSLSSPFKQSKLPSHHGYFRTSHPLPTVVFGLYKFPTAYFFFSTANRLHFDSSIFAPTIA